MEFEQRKKNQLSKKDKSNEQKWDDRILNLCEKINSKKEYYTTSSCSGRVTLTKSSENKSENAFLFKSHDKISFLKLKKELEKAKDCCCLVYFKEEPCILAAACENLEAGKKLIELGQNSGWKRSSIISPGERIIVELMSTEKLEFPIIADGKILVDDAYLKLLVSESNKKLEKSWEKIAKLASLM